MLHNVLVAFPRRCLTVNIPCFSPVIVEIPHFGSMRGKERELIVLRSDNGDTWREHQFDIGAEDLTELLAGMDEGNERPVCHASHRIWSSAATDVPD